MIKASTKQYQAHLAELIEKKQFVSSCTPYLYSNWKAWLVYTAYERDILSLRKNKYRMGVIKVINDMKELYLFVCRTWGDNEENDWAWSNFWKRGAIALSAMSLFEMHKNGSVKQKLRPYNKAMSEEFDKFIRILELIKDGGE